MMTMMDTKAEEPTKKSQQQSQQHHKSNPTIWTIIQISLLFVLFLLNLHRGSQCTLLESSTSLSAEDGENVPTISSSLLRYKASVDISLNEYSRPVSDRVPKGGIETVLTTSTTQPTFHIFTHSRTKDIVTERIIESGIYEADSTTSIINKIVCDNNK